jgi:hypothetical protein
MYAVVLVLALAAFAGLAFWAVKSGPPPDGGSPPYSGL